MEASFRKVLDEDFIKSSDFDRIIGKNATYYKVAFQKIIDQEGNDKIRNGELITIKENSKSRFNWPAGIFSIFWFAYRKMWKYALIFFGLETVLFAIMEWARPMNDASGSLSPKGFGTFIGVVVVLAWVAGTIANTYYFRHIQELLKKSASIDEAKLASGTSWAAVLGMIVIQIAVTTLQTLIF